MAKTNTKKYQVVRVWEDNGTEVIEKDISYSEAKKLATEKNVILTEHDARNCHYEFQEQ